MKRLPQRSTRTYTRVPYTTLFRSDRAGGGGDRRRAGADRGTGRGAGGGEPGRPRGWARPDPGDLPPRRARRSHPRTDPGRRSEEHTSELQSLMRISYSVFCLKTKTTRPQYMIPKEYSKMHHI